METYRIAVGSAHDVKPGNIVGAIANEAGLDSENIGRVDIHEDYSLIDLPEGMPKKIFRDLQKVWVCGQQLQISRLNESDVPRSEEHTSELQSLMRISYAVFCLKKNNYVTSTQ